MTTDEFTTTTVHLKRSVKMAGGVILPKGPIQSPNATPVQMPTAKGTRSFVQVMASNCRLYLVPATAVTV